MPKKTATQASIQKRTADLISVTEASSISGLTTSFIRRLLRTGQLEGVKISRNWLTSEEAIRSYLRTKRRRGRPKQSDRD